jgi:excisionase family DNA binding protein
MNTHDTHSTTILTTEQMARLAQVHATTLRNWARAGRVRHYRFGRALRFKPDEVLADLAVPTR